MSLREESSCSPSPSCSSQSLLNDLVAANSRAVTSESETSLVYRTHSDHYFLNLTVFLMDGMIHQRGLEVAHDYLKDQVRGQLEGLSIQYQSLQTLIPLLQLADVESRLGDILNSYASTVQLRTIIQSLDGKDSPWVYWTQRLEIKILQRGGLFERAHSLALEIYEYQKDQLELEQENNWTCRETSGPHDQDACDGSESIKPKLASWRRLVIMADQLVQLRKFQDALITYEMARDELVITLNVDPHQPEEPHQNEDKSGNLFFIQNRIIKLLLKMRRFDQAMTLALPLLDDQKARCGDSHYSVLKTLHHVAVILKYQGNYEKALDLALQLESKIKLDRDFDADSLYEYLTPKMYPAVEVNLAELRLFLGQPYEGLASACYSQVFQRVLHLLGETHPVKVETTLNLGTWYMRHKKDKLEFSRQLFQRLYTLQTDMWGPTDVDSLWTKQFIEHCTRKYSDTQNDESRCTCHIL